MVCSGLNHVQLVKSVPAGEQVTIPYDLSAQRQLQPSEVRSKFLERFFGKPQRCLCNVCCRPGALLKDSDRVRALLLEEMKPLLEFAERAAGKAPPVESSEYHAATFAFYRTAKKFAQEGLLLTLCFPDHPILHQYDWWERRADGTPKLEIAENGFVYRLEDGPGDEWVWRPSDETVVAVERDKWVKHLRNSHTPHPHTYGARWP